MSRINRELQLTLQSAVREAVARRHADLTLEHLLFALIHDERGAEIVRHAGVDLARLKAELERFLREDLEAEPGEDELETRQTLAVHRVLQSALQHAESAEKEEVEAGDLIAAFFGEPDSHAVALLRSQGVSRLDVLRYISHGVSKLSPDADGSGPESARVTPAEADEEGAPADPLEAFAVDLTAQARSGALDPLVGRAQEIERVIHILARRRKNNPILVGETGVGKTAIAEGLAQRIAAGEGKADLRGAEIFSLDLGALLAGTRYRGDFEARFKALVAEILKRRRPILFIDEIHTILGAGSAQGGTVDASNLLKPLLQAGELRCMGSTTYQEYRHFERDRALARRFQRVDVREPTVEETVLILRGLAPRYEEHHGVHYTHAALRACAELSSRHLSDRFLPDKAIDVMDEVGAATRLRYPSEEESSGAEASESEASQTEASEAAASEAAAVPESTDSEATEGPPASGAKRSAQRGAAERSKSKSKNKSKSKRKIGTRDVETLVARMAGIPMLRASTSERARLEHLEDDLRGVLFGQDAAVGTVVRAIKRARAGLGGRRRPAGSFLFVGPTGVGKTELARQLANSLEVPFHRFDMSEYMEKHAVARLIGAPPGYVGYDEGGQLVERIRKNPHAVLLLDEIEKAHQDLFDILLQVMDHATLTDNHGREADFRHVVLIMTSNAGTRDMAARQIGFAGGRRGGASKEIERLFSPEFRNRLDETVTFAQLTPEVMTRVVDKFIAELQGQLSERKVALELSDAARDWLAKKGFDPDFGARPLARVIQTEVNDRISEELLFGVLAKGGRARVDADAEGLRFEFLPRGSA